MARLTRDRAAEIRDTHSAQHGPIPWCRICNTFAPCEQRQLAIGWIAANRPAIPADIGATPA